MPLFEKRTDRRDFLSTALRLSMGGAAALLGLGCASGPAKGPAASAVSPGDLRPPATGPWIDCHAHLQPLFSVPNQGLLADWHGAVQVALERMDAVGISRSIFMPPPMGPGQEGAYDARELSTVCADHADWFSFLAGGGSLNAMIQKTWQQGSLDARLERQFRDTAEGILAMGSLGFGEMTAEHFSLTDNHPYESAPPDHPLFLLLADIAAERGVPIDMHMEAVPQAMDLPGHLFTPPNPGRLRPNIAGFEALLAHNPKARIIWSHAGWGHTGMRTPELCEGLLAKHPNLFMSFKTHRHSRPESRALAQGRLKPTWLRLVQQYPDRFVIGSDQFYLTPQSEKHFPNSMFGALAILNSLPPDLARRVGQDNPRVLFKL